MFIPETTADQVAVGSLIRSGVRSAIEKWASTPKKEGKEEKEEVASES